VAIKELKTAVIVKSRLDGDNTIGVGAPAHGAEMVILLQASIPRHNTNPAKTK
jgi:hypothetical protein